MVLFEGVEPIYQIGTCDNLVSNLSYYLSETNEDTVLGIDGGDGSYNVINEHESVASVTFTDDVNGYQRIKIHPLAEGETIVKVMDGSAVARTNSGPTSSAICPISSAMGFWS